jgi:hypothetical protein
MEASEHILSLLTTCLIFLQYIPPVDHRSELYYAQDHKTEIGDQSYIVSIWLAKMETGLQFQF